MADRTTDKGVYHSDILAVDYTCRVDDNLFDQTAALGWTADPGGLTPLPHSVRPRHAVGVDDSGRRHSVVVATTGADLWTRSTTDWTFIDGSGTEQTAHLTGLVGEAVTF